MRKLFVLVLLVIITLSAYAGINEDFIKSAKHGNMEFIKQALKKGIDVNFKDKDGQTALISASRNPSRYGYLALVKYLITHKADVNVNYGDYNVLSAAAAFGHLPIVKYIISNTPLIETSIINAALLKVASHYKYYNENDLAIIKYLIKQGADVNAKDNYYGKTVILYVADNDHHHLYGKKPNLSLLKYLIEQGADVNSKDKEGNSVLMRAVSTENLEVIKYLVSVGADVKAKNKRGKYCFNEGSIWKKTGSYKVSGISWSRC